MSCRKLVSVASLVVLGMALTCLGQQVPEPSAEWTASVTIGDAALGDAEEGVAGPCLESAFAALGPAVRARARLLGRSAAVRPRP